MRMTINILILVLLVLSARTAAAQSGKFCDPSWCRVLDRMERAQWGKKLVDAVATLHLSAKYRLKPRQLKPEIPWLGRKLKKVPKKLLVAACPDMAAGFKNGSFPYPLRFLGVFDLPKIKKKKIVTKQWLQVQVEFLPGPASIPDLEKDHYSSMRDKGDGYFIWEKAWVTGKDRKRPDLAIDVTIVVGDMQKGQQTAPDGSNAHEQVAEAKSVTIRLHGPRWIVDSIVKHTDLNALKHLLEN